MEINNVPRVRASKKNVVLFKMKANTKSLKNLQLFIFFLFFYYFLCISRLLRNLAYCVSTRVLLSLHIKKDAHATLLNSIYLY